MTPNPAHPSSCLRQTDGQRDPRYFSYPPPARPPASVRESNRIKRRQSQRAPQPSPAQPSPAQPSAVTAPTYLPTPLVLFSIPFPFPTLSTPSFLTPFVPRPAGRQAGRQAPLSLSLYLVSCFCLPALPACSPPSFMEGSDTLRSYKYGFGSISSPPPPPPHGEERDPDV